MSFIVYRGCRLMLIGALAAFACSMAYMAVWAAPWSYVLLLAIPVSALRKRRRQALTACGTARLADEDDLKNAGMLDTEEGLILGRISGHQRPSIPAGIRALLSPRVSAEDACRTLLAAISSPKSAWARSPLVRLPRSAVHTAVFAPPGAGKSTGICIPFLLTDRQACVVVDFKGELALATAEHRHRVFGHEIIILDPFKVVTQ